MATKTLYTTLVEEYNGEAVRKQYGSRSDYLRRLTLDDLYRRREWAELIGLGDALGRQLGITGEEQVNQSIMIAAKG